MTYPAVPWVDPWFGLSLDEVDASDMTDNITVPLNLLQASLYAGYSSYTPSISSSGTAPGFGTGFAANGRFKVFGGNMCHVVVSIAWGTSPTVGTGTYRITLPIAWQNDGVSPVFTSELVISGTGEYSLVAKPFDATHLVFSRGDGTANQLGAAYPSAPTANWILLFSGVYRCGT